MKNRAELELKDIWVDTMMAGLIGHYFVTHGCFMKLDYKIVICRSGIFIPEV